MGSELSPEEFNAIQAAMGRSRRGEAAEGDIEAVPIALIAGDRDAEKARPNAARIAGWWAKTLPAQIQSVCGMSLDIQSVAVDVVDGGGLKELLETSWNRCVQVHGRSDLALLVGAGPMVEGLSACLLGAPPDEADESNDDRPPSQMAREVFTRIGRTAAEQLAKPWYEVQECKVDLLEDTVAADAWRRGLSSGDAILSTSINLSGDTSGRFILLARPQTLVVPPAPIGSVPAPPGAVEFALGGVPVEVRVELGRVRMSMAALARLAPGALLPLDKFITDPLPIRVGGKMKGYGRALVVNGSLAVEVVDPTITGGRS